MEQPEENAPAAVAGNLDELAKRAADLQRADSAANVQEAGAPGDEPAPAKKLTIAQEWQAGAELACTFLTKRYPELADIYTDERVQELGQALGDVAQKYGLSLGSWTDRYSAEIALAWALYQVGPPTLAAIKARNEAKAAPRGASSGAAAADFAQVASSSSGPGPAGTEESLRPHTE